MTKTEFKAQAQALGVNANTVVKLSDMFTDETTRIEFLTALADEPLEGRQKFAEKKLNPMPANVGNPVIIRKPEQGSELGKVSAIRFDKADARIAKDNTFVRITERSVDANGIVTSGETDYTRSHYNITVLTSDGKKMNLTAGHKLMMRQLEEPIGKLRNDEANANLRAEELIKMCLLGTYIMVDFNYYKAHENGIQISYERADDSAANATYKTCVSDERHVSNIIPDTLGDFAELFTKQQEHYLARDTDNVELDKARAKSKVESETALAHAKLVAENNERRVTLLKSLVPEGATITPEHIELFKLMQV